MSDPPQQPGTSFGQLSARELEVVRLVAEGRANQDIATALGISTRTVQSHVAAALSKTGSSSRTQLAVRALRAGVASLYPNQSACKQSP